MKLLVWVTNTDKEEISQDLSGSYIREVAGTNPSLMNPGASMDLSISDGLFQVYFFELMSRNLPPASKCSVARIVAQALYIRGVGEMNCLSIVVPYRPVFPSL